MKLVLLQQNNSLVIFLCFISHEIQTEPNSISLKCINKLNFDFQKFILIDGSTIKYFYTALHFAFYLHTYTAIYLKFNQD